MAATDVQQQRAVGPAAAAPASDTQNQQQRGIPEKVNKPDKRAYYDRIEAEAKAIEQIRAKINEIQQKIEPVIGGRDEFNREKAERREALDALQKQIEELEERRRVLFDKIQSKQKEGAEMKQSASDLRKRIGFNSAAEVDSKILALEKAMMTSTLTLKEEKTMLEDIKKLKNCKPLFGKYAAMEQSASSFEDQSVIPLRASLDEVRTKILELRSKKREENAKYKQLIEERQAARAPGRELIEEREVLRKELEKHYQQKRSIQEELKREQFMYDDYVNYIKRIRDAKMREEREKRQGEAQREELERALEDVDTDIPLNAECLLLIQTIAFLDKLIEEQKTENNNEVKDNNKNSTSNIKDVAAPKGAAGQALLPKNQREEVFFFAPKTKAKKNADKKVKPQPIKYDIGTLGYFQKCGVQAPVFPEELPPCRDTLQKKLDEYRGQQQELAARVDERRATLQAKLAALDGKLKRKNSPDTGETN